MEVSSRLIESLILNIPIPTVYLSQDVDVDEEVDDDVARYSVIDGQQRLTAIYGFMTNDYALEGLDVLELLNGSFYKDLPPFLIRRLEERTIKCLRIDSTVDPKVKFDIFERLNSGAVQLESQELKNAVYRGKFNDMIKDLSQNKTFRILLNIDLKNLDKYFEEIGGGNFWGYITDCNIEKVFENDSDIVRNLLDTLRNVLALGVEDFPYHIELTSAGYNLSRAKVSEECLWKVFLNQTLNARHDVAHGVSQYQKSFYKCVSFIKKRNLGSDSKKEN